MVLSFVKRISKVMERQEKLESVFGYAQYKRKHNSGAGKKLGLPRIAPEGVYSAPTFSVRSDSSTIKDCHQHDWV